MNETPLTPTEADIARRLGRVAGMLVLEKVNPDSIQKVPGWVKICSRQIAEAAVQGGGAAVGGAFAESPEFSLHAMGMSLGTIGSMVSLVRNPTDGQAGNIKPWLDEYFRAYFEAVLNGPAPADGWREFAQAIFGMFLGGSYEQRLEFAEGVRLGSEVEKTVRSGETRETTATRIYLELLLFWPEVVQMGKLSAVYAFLQSRFKDAPDRLGEFDRFRKLANRIELSFQGQ